MCTETAYQRIGREQRERQEARAQREIVRGMAARNRPRRVGKHPALGAPYGRAADHIDGYDRDDLGESHD